jgi:hypothetical protein
VVMLQVPKGICGLKIWENFFLFLESPNPKWLNAFSGFRGVLAGLLEIFCRFLAVFLRVAGV